MPRPASFDILFEPVRIGPVVARNRFFQVPHCNGMGRAFPSSMAAMRGIKAEGGWAVVCTEQCDIHPTGNIGHEIRLWDARDVPYLARMTDEVHRHGALAGIELVHNGYRVENIESREVPLAPSLKPSWGVIPVTARAMDRADIRAVRRWYRTAALNAREAGFDIVYVYAGHDLALPMHFLSRRHNQRTDEYGGSLENRARLLRELIEDVKDAVGTTCAVAVRLAVDELLGPTGLCAAGEGRDVIAMLAELPDLWDVNLSGFANDSQTSRFADEGYQEPYVGFVKSVTTKPVVGVGRFTSPDTMASMIRRGVLDFIGAARPSIADPFLPRKIEEGRFDDIRECIGCNICVTGAFVGGPTRCTQNPTMGEEWRRGWHPERLPSRSGDDVFLVVGAGPAGLEAARALGQRGYTVMLADRERTLGGRVSRECRLPGLATWGRVRDWRLGQLRRMQNVDLLPDNDVTTDIVLGAGASRVAIATGARWRDDGGGRFHIAAIPGLDGIPVYTPDDIMSDRLPRGDVVLFDDDHYYMGGVIAERLSAAGCRVTFVTPEGQASAFTQFTLEQARIQKRLIEICASLRVSSVVSRVAGDEVLLACRYTGRETPLRADALVLVTGTVPNDGLFRELQVLGDERLHGAGIRHVHRIGDCLGPGTIAAAVYSGHLFARTLSTDPDDVVPYRRENVELLWDEPLPVPGAVT